MTELERRAITALRSAKVPEKTWHWKRAEALNMALSMRASRPLLSAQEADLWFLVWRYRRQIDDPQLVAKANEIVNGVMALEF